MSNTVINAALDRLNQANLESATNKAASLVVKISQLQGGLKASKDSEAELQKELNLLQQPAISETSVLGSPLPAAGVQNVNQEVIAKAIANLQKSKLECVAAKSDRLSQGIVAEQDVQAGIQAEITKLIAELNAITPEVVTESEITGQ